MRLDAYIRVSRVGKREGASFISPDVQRDQIRRWAEAHGATIAAEHVDLDESGGKTDRPGFQAMLGRVEAGATDGVVVAKLDRFARSLAGALDAIQRIDSVGATFVSVAEGIDPTTPAGKMMHRLMLVLAEFELDRITESWAVAQQRAVERGVHFMVPFGYRRPEKGAVLEPDPDTARFVGDVFRKRAAGVSWHDLARWLNGRVRSPSGGDWVPRTVKHLVDNEAYLGVAYHGRFRKEGAHPPLVTRDEWEAAQGKPGLRPVRVNEALLTGIIRCAGCRYRMKTDRGGRPRVRIYRCRGRHGAGRCPAPASVTAEIAEEYVVERFLARYGRLQVRPLEQSRDLHQAREVLAEAEAELTAFASETRIRKALGHDRYVSQLEARAAAVDEAQTEVDRAQRAARGVGLAVMPNVWRQLEPDERRALLRAGIDAVFLRRTGNLPIAERVRVVWAGEGEDDLPGPGHRVGIRSFDWHEDEPGVTGGE